MTAVRCDSEASSAAGAAGLLAAVPVKRWTDHDGHHWPITGQVCVVCGLPRTDVGDGQSAHPLCVGPPPGGRPIGGGVGERGEEIR